MQNQININKLKNFIKDFNAPIKFACAYGSGVFKQSGYNDTPMIDLIFGVTNPENWHCYFLMIFKV